MDESEFNALILVPLLKGATETSRKNLAKSRSKLSRWQILYAEAAIFQQVGDAARASQRYADAMRSGARSFDFFVNYATHLQRIGRHAESIQPALEAIRISPLDRKAVVAILTAYLDQSRVKEAIALIEQLPETLKLDRQIQLAYCASLRQDGNYYQALELLRELASKYPSDSTVLRMLADTIGEKDSEAALPVYEKAFTKAVSDQSPGIAAIKWNMSLHLLRTRDFVRGWDFYSAGLTREVGTLGRKLPANLHGLKLLTFEDACASRDEYVLIIVEQGIGDQVLFFSVFKEALRNIAKPLLMCEPRLKALLSRSFPGVQIIDPGLLEYIATMSLPLAGYLPLGNIMAPFRKSVGDFISARKPYLVVDKSKYLDYRSRLKAMAKGRPIVGISWKGGYWENQQRNKTIAIEDWEAVFRRDALVVNLQYGNIESDVAWTERMGFELIRFPKIDFKHDIDDWLAIAAACDGIVSISTALVHFAGAFGQKVALILAERQGPFIWGLSESRSIIYPNVHIFRPVAGEPVAEMVYRVSMVIK